MTPENPDIRAVIVTYEYDYQRLRRLLSAISPQVGGVLVVDNNTWPDRAGIFSLEESFPACRVLINQENIGLARALNLGIAEAVASGAEKILLLDQDSLPASNMLAVLIRAWQDLAMQGFAPAALGPMVVDRRYQRPLPFVRFRGGSIKRVIPDPEGNRFFETDFLITSGCLISRQALKEIGSMDEGLFISNIDLEWCFRARSLGWTLHGVEGAVLRHSLGDKIVSLPILGGEIVVHDALRQYHIMRNRFILYRRSYAPWSWKLADIPRMLFKLFFFSVFVSGRWQNLTAMLKGVRDGLSD